MKHFNANDGYNDDICVDTVCWDDDGDDDGND